MEYYRTVENAGIEFVKTSDDGERALYRVIWYGGAVDVWTAMGGLEECSGKTITLTAREWKPKSITVSAKVHE